MNHYSRSQKEVHSKHLYQYGDRIIEYNLIKSKRRKTCEITVYKNEIVLRTPLDKSMPEIEKILQQKIKWVTKKQKEFKEERVEIIKPIYEDRSTLPFLGTNYKMSIISKNENEIEKLEFNNNEFVINLHKDTIDQKSRIEKLYITWLNEMARKIFKEKVEVFSEAMGIYPSVFVLKNLKNRWGSLSKDQTINLNVNLVKTPNAVIDYIIIHELCHFKIRGHSHQFWQYLQQFEPNYEQKIKWLERNTDSLLQ